MTDWKKVTGTQPDKPEEVDRTSSPSTVYLRKNIEQVTREVEGSDGKMQTVTESSSKYGKYKLRMRLFIVDRNKASAYELTM